MHVYVKLQLWRTKSLYEAAAREAVGWDGQG